MDHLFNAFVTRRTSTDQRQNYSCGDIPDLYIPKKKTLKRASSGSRHSPPSPSPLSNSMSMDRVKSKSNSELVNVVDAQLMQIREKLAAFREQDTQFRERMDSLSNSVSELTSRSSRSSLSSFTPSECSDLGSLDEASEEEEEFEQQTVGQKAFSEEPPRLLRLPTVRVTGRGYLHRRPAAVRCFHTRQASDPSSMQSHIELPEEEAIETQRYSTYSADQAINLYPQYNNAEEISTLF